jgi:hypothetical protein
MLVKVHYHWRFVEPEYYQWFVVKVHFHWMLALVLHHTSYHHRKHHLHQHWFSHLGSYYTHVTPPFDSPNK